MTTLWLDYESQSECDLVKHGAYQYAQHASTKMLCAAYAFDDEDVQLWWAHEPVPQRLADYFRSGGQIRAHNEEFDRLITWYVVCPDYGLAEPALERWYCTAAQARANCAPGSLEDVGRFAGASMKKDHRGKQLVRMCCVPPFNKDPKVLAELGEYAMQDVRAMRAVSNAMRQLSDEELADYHVNARINARGVLVDVDLCRAAQRYAGEEMAAIEREVQEITAGVLTSVRSPKMREWVHERVGPQAKELMQVGERVSIDKSVRANLLAIEDPAEVPPDVADVIQCADDIFASSVSKFSRFTQLADVEDFRVRGAFVFAGGSATGRAASYGIQLHNLSRKTAQAPEDVRHAMVRGHEVVPKFGKRVTDVLKSMLRPAIVAAPGNVLVNYDWNAIEARVLPWLSGDGEATLDVFRRGEDMYVATARAMFGVTEVAPDQRQQAKVAILSCGFGGGIGALAAMARGYGMAFSEAEAKRIVDLWRRANPWAQIMWRRTEDAYRRAMRNPMREFSAGRVTYLFDGQTLWYELPSGRILCYPFARFEADGEITYAKSAWKPAADAKEWPRAKLWYGVAVENQTQAVAHDILRHALRGMDKEGIQVTAHVHDEVVAECLEVDAQRVSERMQEIMCAPPAWAEGLPLAVAGVIATRYS